MINFTVGLRYRYVGTTPEYVNSKVICERLSGGYVTFIFPDNTTFRYTVRAAQLYFTEIDKIKKYTTQETNLCTTINAECKCNLRTGGCTCGVFKSEMSAKGKNKKDFWGIWTK